MNIYLLMLFQGPGALWFVTNQDVGFSESEMLEARPD